jgi:hypothetical protein
MHPLTQWHVVEQDKLREYEKQIQELTAKLSAAEKEKSTYELKCGEMEKVSRLVICVESASSHDDHVGIMHVQLPLLHASFAPLPCRSCANSSPACQCRRCALHPTLPVKAAAGLSRGSAG